MSVAVANLTVMSVWERERVIALSPDTASTVAAQQLARPDRWTAAGAGDGALWGKCQGSGRLPYQTVVDLGPTFGHTCTCPSRKQPCKHVLALLLLWSSGAVPSDTEPDFAAAWRRSRAERSPGEDGPVRRSGSPADPDGAARRAAARLEKVAAGLDDLELWLHDQVRTGLAGLERAGYPHFDRVAARMVDAQAPGVAAMLRSVPAELGRDGWPERVLERLGALQLLVTAHRRLPELPPELAANVRARVGYPVTRAEVLTTPAVADEWVAVGSVDSVEYQLESRRVWLYGTTTRRWALSLSFAAPGMSLDSTVLPGQLFAGAVHFYPGSSGRVVLADGDVTQRARVLERLPAEDFSQVRRRLADLLAVDPWATRLPALVLATPSGPHPGQSGWRLGDQQGQAVALTGLPGDPWPLVARSGGEPVRVFGEWSDQGFRPLSLLPDDQGNRFSTELVG